MGSETIRLFRYRTTYKLMQTTTLPSGNVTVRTGSWQELGQSAQWIRQAVFVEEQRIPAELERDPADAGCLHAVAFDADGTALGTGRLLPLADGVMKLGRLAVLR